ncbi:hypothetical protein NCC49_004177 [Naganishia albida]|nr:hypothetical protein NCC49_004177 [Naganishia albida]
MRRVQRRRIRMLVRVAAILFDEEVTYGFQTTRDVSYQPKISLIGVWAGNEEPNYLHWFLESVARQPEDVELVVIQRGKRLGNFGGDVVANAENIRVVKMSDDRYWDLHRNYLCRRWGCNERDRRRIDRHLRDLGRYDPQSYGLSILRGEVFKAYTHPGAEWWGWCDFDTVMGSFKRKFPWDIAKDYDVLLPAHRNTDTKRLLFMRGHLTFFRNTPQASEKITGHPDFATKEGCRKLKTIGCSPKEASYSSYIVNNPDINFLAFDALPMKHYLMMAPSGVYSLQNGLEDPKRGALVAQRIADDKEDLRTTVNLSTFSDQGKVRDITLVQGKYPAGALWFYPRHATHYEPIYGDGDPTFRNDDYLTYVYRLNGEVKERLEPVRKVEDRPDVMEEWLYLHWQEEKKKDWFLAIPEEVEGDGWMLLTQGHDKGGYWVLTADDVADRSPMDVK